MSWELGFGIGAVLLLLVLVWGVMQARRASPREEALAEAGARKAYAGSGGDSDAPPRGGHRKAVPPLVWVVVFLLAAWMVLAGVMSRREPARPGEAVSSGLEHVPPGQQTAPAPTVVPEPQANRPR